MQDDNKEMGDDNNNEALSKLAPTTLSPLSIVTQCESSDQSIYIATWHPLNRMLMDKVLRGKSSEYRVHGKYTYKTSESLLHSTLERTLQLSYLVLTSIKMPS